MKKILIINDYSSIVGGAEKATFDSFELLSKSYDVKLYFGTDKPLDKKSLFSYFLSYQSYKRLIIELFNFKPDIIFVHNYYVVLTPSILLAIKRFRKKFNSKVIHVAHDYSLLIPNSILISYNNDKITRFNSPPSLLDIIVKNLSKKGVLNEFTQKIKWILAYKILNLQKTFDQIIAPSKYMKLMLELGETTKKIPIIHQYSFVSINYTKNNLKKNKESIKLIFAGRLELEKGIYNFIQILSYVKDFNFHLNIFGEGSYKDEILNIIIEAGLTNKVTLHGKVSNHVIIKEIEDSDILVLTSLWAENAPMALIEAGLLNKYFITSNFGGMAEIAKLFQNPYVIDFENTESSISTIKNAFRDVIDIPTRHISNETRELFSKEVYLKRIEAIVSI